MFVPDSAGYLAAASLLGGVAARVGAERVALPGCAAVGLAALLLPLAGGLGALAAPHALLGLGLGATDAALLPALLTRHRTRVAPAAALLQAAASAAYALGPALGGLASWALGFETTMRALGVLNLLYAAFLYRALSLHPLSEKVRFDRSVVSTGNPAPEKVPFAVGRRRRGLVRRRHVRRRGRRARRRAGAAGGRRAAAPTLRRSPLTSLNRSF